MTFVLDDSPTLFTYIARCQFCVGGGRHLTHLRTQQTRLTCFAPVVNSRIAPDGRVGRPRLLRWTLPDSYPDLTVIAVVGLPVPAVVDLQASGPRCPVGGVVEPGRCCYLPYAGYSRLPVGWLQLIWI